MPIESITEVIGTSEAGSASNRTVVIAVDDSKFSEYAVTHATEQLLQPKDFVVIVNVEHIKLSAGLGSVAERFKEANYQGNEALLIKYHKLVSDKGFECKAVSISGSVKEAIVQYVRKIGADILIVGSRGSDAFSRALIGSVSDYCAHHCHSSVLIVKPSVSLLKEWGVLTGSGNHDAILNDTTVLYNHGPRLQV